MKPGFLVVEVLSVLVIILVVVIAFTAIYAHDPARKCDAQGVLRTLFGRDRKLRPSYGRQARSWRALP